MRRSSLALFLLSGSLLVAGSPGRSEEEAETLLSGPPRELAIREGERHIYRVDVGEDPVLVLVEQQGVDLMLEARAGQEPLTISSPNKSWGPEVLLLPAGAARSEPLEVRLREKSVPPGRYTIQAEALVGRTEEGARRIAAFALMSRGGRLALGPPAEQSEALSVYREALAAWRTLGERRWEAEALLAIAALEHQAADLRAGTADYRQAVTLWRELAEPRRVAALLNLLAFTCQRSGDIAAGRTAAEEALALWQSLGETFEDKESRNVLCLLDMTDGALPEARACYEELLAFYRAHGLQRGEATALTNLGGTYDQTGEPDAALDHYGKALALWQALGDRAEEARTLKNIGPVHRALGEW